MTERRVGLATEEIVGNVPVLIQALSDELAGHSRLDIGNSHGELAAGQLNLFDRNTHFYDGTQTQVGKKVGTWGVKVEIAGRQWFWPATLALTGPGKVPRLGAFNPSFYSWSTTGPGEHFYNEFHPTPTTLGGDATLVYHYEYFLNGDWINWPSVEDGGSPASLQFTDGTGLIGQYSKHDGVVTFGSGGDGTHTLVARLTLSNSVGSTHKIWPNLTADCTFQYQFTHHPGSWMLFQTMKVRPFTPTEIFRIHKLRAWSKKHYPEETAFYTGFEGRTLVDMMVKAKHDFSSTLPVVNIILSEKSYEERYAAFRDLVLDCCAIYWPTCPHPIWRKYQQVTLQRLSQALQGKLLIPPQLSPPSECSTADQVG